MLQQGKYSGFTLDHIYQTLRSKDANILANRKWLGITYENCFVAREVIDFLINKKFCEDFAEAGCKDKRDRAEDICKDLHKQDLIMHVWNTKKIKFADAYYFFKFTDTSDSTTIPPKKDPNKKSSSPSAIPHPSVSTGSAIDPKAADFYDLIVIGAGVAGIAAAAFASGIGVNCLCIEANRLGGDCTWTGCVPSKALIHCSHTMYEATQGAKHLATDDSAKSMAQVATDMRKVRSYVQDKIKVVADIDQRTMEDMNVKMKYGMATFEDPYTITLTKTSASQSSAPEKELLKAKGFVLCLGAEPSPPPIKGLDGVKYLTYENVFDVGTMPKSLIVVGAGVIGSELAQSYQRMGCKVTLVGNCILPKEPKKVDTFLAKQFEEDGMTIMRGRGVAVEKCKEDSDVVKGFKGLDASDPVYEPVTLTVKNSKGELKQVSAECMLVASGRRPRTYHMNLSKGAGVELDKETNLIKVTPELQTTASHIYAAGDCCTLHQFTHYAGIMGFWAVRNMLLPGSQVPQHVIPRATFTTPEVASVGLTEDECIAKYGKENISILHQPNSHSERAICENDLKGFCDVYVEKKTGLIRGAVIMHKRAGETLTEITNAMALGTKFTNLAWNSAIHAYPTYSFSVMMLASEAANRDFHDSFVGNFTKWYVKR